MKILITGGAGFVGRHFCYALAQNRNNDIWVVDNLSTGLKHDEWMPHLQVGQSGNVQFYYEDVLDWIKKHNESFDLIVHLAAIVEGRLTIDNDPLKVAHDLAIDAYFFKWLLKNKPGTLMYFSSSAVYPVKYQMRENSLALSEGLQSLSSQEIGFPDMTYGWSKLTGEYLTHIFHRQTDCPCIIFRPFSGYGEDQPKTYPFPSLLDRIIAAKERTNKIIDVWGSGEQIRDFIYIDDCVRFALGMLGKEQLVTVNIGTGAPTSFKELIEKASHELEIESYSINPLMDKPQGVFCRYADTTLQARYLDFHLTNLVQGIHSYLEYNRQ